MAKLIVNPTSASRREVPLPRTLLSIGRDPSNDLVLPDAMVSRRHAVIEFRGSQYFLRDCNSSNGSLVNGDKVSERNLRDGDLVAIGTARLLFRDDYEFEDAGGKVVQHPSAPRLQCPSCNADYRKGDLFCRQCGTQLAQSLPKVICTSCGTVVPLPAKFCNACGGALSHVEPPQGEAPPGVAASEARPEPAPAPAKPEPPRVEPPAERSGEPLEPRPVEAAGAPRVVTAVDHALQSSPEPVREALPAPVPPPPPKPWSAPQARPEAWPGDIERLRGLRPASALKAPGGFGRRLVAGLLDSVLVSLGQALLLIVPMIHWLSSRWPPSPNEPLFLWILGTMALVFLAAGLGIGYYLYFWGVRGATPGKTVLGLRVEGADGKFPIGLGKAAARLFGYLLSLAFLGIGFLVVAFGKTALHDRIAGTRVVRWERG